MKTRLLLLLCCFLLNARGAYAEDTTWYGSPTHFVVLMPSDRIDIAEGPEHYEGVTFPLFCGIASVYPKENKFVFTKMTDLPIRWVVDRFRPVVADGYLFIYGHPSRQVPLRSRDFFLEFLFWADGVGLTVEPVSKGQEIPVKVRPRFKRTCAFSAAKTPPTECGYRNWDIADLYIPFTLEEMRQIAKDHAK